LQGGEFGKNLDTGFGKLLFHTRNGKMGMGRRESVCQRKGLDRNSRKRLLYIRMGVRKVKWQLMGLL